MTHKFKVGEKVIFTNDFGVVYLWTISDLTHWEDCKGRLFPAYHHEGTQTPWYPTEERLLNRADAADLIATRQELKLRYGFTPTEWFGCW